MAINSDISVKDLIKEVKRLEEISDQAHDFNYLVTNDFAKYYDKEENWLISNLTKEIGVFTSIESFRSEGGGDFDGYTWRFSTTFKDEVVRYFEVYGTYSSWDGWDLCDTYEWYEVQEVEKLIKVWEHVT